MSYFRLPRVRIQLLGYIFAPHLLPSLATFCLLTVLIGLGCWQLNRAEQKRTLEHQLATSHHHTYSLDEISPESRKSRYRRVRVEGFFDSHTLLLENKIYRHKVGVQVLTPFVIPYDNRWILVNRGFVPLSNDLALDKANTPNSVIGLIDFPSKPFLLKKDSYSKDWPVHVQAIDLKAFETLLHHKLYPFILLETDTDEHFVRDWHRVTFPSYRHTGYAIQWFALALTLLIIYIVLNTSKVK